MLKDGILVLIGGGIGAVVRELLMLGVANLPGGFPMPIFIANMTAALLIGVLSALTITGGVIGSVASCCSRQASWAACPPSVHLSGGPTRCWPTLLSRRAPSSIWC